MRKLILLFCLAFPLIASAYPFMVGARISTPQILSLSLAYRATDLLFIQVEPGIGGGKAALGIGGSWDYKVGLGLKSSILYTWGNSWGNVEPEQTYAGGEGVLMVSGFNLSFGLYSHIAGDDTEKDLLVSVGAGLGF